MNDLENAQAQWADQSRRQGEAKAVNQQDIFYALAALGIERLEVIFDRCGDSGQIEDATRYWRRRSPQRRCGDRIRTLGCRKLV